MYLSFYNLDDEPFRLTPDPRFLHLSQPHQTALQTLLEGILYRRGLIMITGPIGTGKTTLIDAALQLLYDLSKNGAPIRTALIFDPTLTREDFLETVLDEFEVSCTSTSKPARLSALQDMLLETQRQGATAALFIDEAHLLSPELLEAIRLLGNADTFQAKLLQIVLCGQPELTTMLNRRELSALKQRIACRANLRPLNEAEMQVYLEERLHIAGLKGASPFASATSNMIFRYSQGVPRLINLLCEECLVLGFKTQQKMIPPDLVERVADSLDITAPGMPSERSNGTSARMEVPIVQKSAVDLMIEAMKRNRAAGGGSLG
ncbi:MAG TPA: AAA family ATPase [Candidatus Bathyarchaeia archaeon]|nr:AAA family ATPase [Candidatus Bathyarchaeia archaeon]